MIYDVNSPLFFSFLRRKGGASDKRVLTEIWSSRKVSKMASTVEQAAAPSAVVVGNAFVHQYYVILHQSPELVHRFYHDISKLGRPEGDGVMSTTTTLQSIDEKILSIDYKGIGAEIITVDSQESYNGGVIVLVTGFLTGKDNTRLKFTQSFFLAPQEKGYFVLNDVLRYVEDEQQQRGNQDSVDAVEAPLASSPDPSLVQENCISENTAVSLEETNGLELYNSSENGDDTLEEEEAPVPEFVDEVPDDSWVLKVMKEGACLCPRLHLLLQGLFRRAKNGL